MSHPSHKPLNLSADSGGDSALRYVVAALEAGAESEADSAWPMTIIVQGAVIRGSLVSASKWAEQIRRGAVGTSTEGTGVFELLGRNLTPAQVNDVRYLHLVGAADALGLEVGAGDQSVLRVRISTISAWALR